MNPGKSCVKSEMRTLLPRKAKIKASEAITKIINNKTKSNTPKSVTNSSATRGPTQKMAVEQCAVDHIDIIEVRMN